MTAWIMTDSSGMPISRNFYDLAIGFKELGEEVKFYNAADIFADTIPHTDNDIVVGHIDQCRRYISLLNEQCKTPPNVDYPEPLISFMGRKFWILDLKSVYTQMTGNNPEPIFVKSYDQKIITGFVCRNFTDYVEHCTGHDLNTVVYVSEVVDFKAEFRTYIHRHDIVACLRYKGDYDKAPCKATVEAMLYALRNTKMPVAYSIDVGILDTGETVLIECNDGFALGNYGVPARRYAEMHRDRWYQIVKEMRG